MQRIFKAAFSTTATQSAPLDVISGSVGSTERDGPQLRRSSCAWLDVLAAPSVTTGADNDTSEATARTDDSNSYCHCQPDAGPQMFQGISERLLQWHGALFPAAADTADNSNEGQDEAVHRASGSDSHAAGLAAAAIFQRDAIALRLGAWRVADIRAGVHEGPPPELVPGLMQAFEAWLCSDAFTSLHPVQQAAFAMAELLWIHPFGDGNGRVARLLGAAILAAHGWPPLTLPPSVREIYLGAAAVSHPAGGGATAPMVQLLALRMTEQMNEMAAWLAVQSPGADLGASDRI